MNLWTVCYVLCVIGCCSGVHVGQLSQLELENSVDPREDVDTSRVLMNDESQTLLDRFLEAFKFKQSKKDGCSDELPAASETKEVEVTDEDWLTTMVKDFDKFITALGEDGDLGLEEGAAESGTKADFKKSAFEGSGTRASRDVKKSNNKNSRGHKMAIELSNRLRNRRNVIGTNKAGLVFIPNKGKIKKGTNRAEIVSAKAKRDVSGPRVSQNNKIESTRERRDVKSLIGTNKAGLISLPKQQDKSKAGSNRIEVVLDEFSNSDQHILSKLLSRRNTKKRDPQFSLVQRREITVQTDNPKLIKAIEKEVAPNQAPMKSEPNNAAVSGEHHAPSVPFLSGGSEAPGSGLTSMIPGVPSNAASPGGGNTPTAVIGGFSMMLVPMPGMSLSNLQNMFQSAQQFSQLLPALPSLPS